MRLFLLLIATLTLVACGPTPNDCYREEVSHNAVDICLSLSSCKVDVGWLKWKVEHEENCH